jgi:UDP-N-acetylmuramoylalanine--D-glutamate ligase
MSITIKKQFANKKIALLGLGIENLSLLKYLKKKKITSEITICDSRSEKDLGDRYQAFSKDKNVTWRLGKSFNQNLFDFDILFRSPGWPLSCPGISEAKKKKKEIVITSAMNLFLELADTKNIIGVTGTKGKGTTASLIAHIFQTDNQKVYLGGNIGTAPFDFLDKIKPTDFVVLELSSFQLEDLTISPKFSVITNIYKEHLAPADPSNPNFHKTFSGYITSKLNIARYQKKTGYLFINKNSTKLLSVYKKYWGQGKKISFGTSPLKSQLVGAYNKENIGAAVTLAKTLRIPLNTIKKAVESFHGLEHRLEFVIEKRGVKYYDNSFATTPESTILDLSSFKNPIILLVGGADKGVSFKSLAKTIKKKVKLTILLEGEGTKRIRHELVKIKYGSKNMTIVKSMEEAIKVAKKNAEPNDVVLLSTACASFGMFNNYKERGDLFKKYARQ